jgi:hypothetical protein
VIRDAPVAPILFRRKSPSRVILKKIAAFSKKSDLTREVVQVTTLGRCFSTPGTPQTAPRQIDNFSTTRSATALTTL